MIIDNPAILREVVGEGRAHPTHTGAETIITELADSLDQYAEEYGALADQEWQPVSESAKVTPVK